MARGKSCKIRTVKAATKSETGGGHMPGPRSATRVVRCGCGRSTARQCMACEGEVTVQRKESQEGEHGEERRTSGDADLHGEPMGATPSKRSQNPMCRR